VAIRTNTAVNPGVVVWEHPQPPRLYTLIPWPPSPTTTGPPSAVAQGGPLQVPFRHEWSPQHVPSATGDHATVEVAGWQVWQGSLAVPASWRALSIQQPALHRPRLHTSPAAQSVPSASIVQALVDVAGWQTWQGSAESGSALAWNVLPIQHPALQAAA